MFGRARVCWFSRTRQSGKAKETAAVEPGQPQYSAFVPGSSTGFEVPARFRISTDRSLPSVEELADPLKEGVAASAPPSYTEFVGNRFPTLETGENYRYWRERGLSKLAPKIFPIHVSTHHRIHPLMRHYMYWLHKADPGRFTIDRLAERYGVKRHSVETIVRRVAADVWLRDRGLGGPKKRQITKEEKISLAKEREFAKRVGYEVLGNQDIDDEREIGEDFTGVTSTSDYIRLQQVEVENFHAFPMPNKRNPVPKRVDVDVLLFKDKRKKIVNWVDPNDKLVF